MLLKMCCPFSFFERHHRFAGWFSVVFVWIFVCLSDSLKPDGTFTTEGRHPVKTQEFWYALFITVLIAIPWTTIRNVPVEVTTVCVVSSPILLTIISNLG
jgi:hypothetical protein